MKFAYRDRDTYLHSADARAKLVALVAVSLALTWASAAATAAVGTGAYVAALSAGVRGRDLLHDIRLVLVILVVGAAARALSDPEGIVAGAAAGAVASGRFVVIIALAYVVSATTRTGDVRLAVEFFLAPLPRVNEKDWGTCSRRRCVSSLSSSRSQNGCARRARHVSGTSNGGTAVSVRRRSRS